MTKFGLAAQCGVVVDKFIAALRSSDTIVAKMASHAIFQYNVLVIHIDNTTLGLM